MNRARDAMRRLRALAVVAALGLALPGSAGAARPASTSSGSSSGVVIFGGGTGSEYQQSSPVRITGALSVTFHGDAATGCAASGLCGYSGVVIWRPPPSGTLEIVSTRSHRHTTYAVSLLTLIDNGVLPTSGTTSATVQSVAGSPSGPGTCLDAAATGSSLQLPVRAGRVSFSLAGATPALLSDRCAGPRGPQILPQLPTPSLTLAALRAGGTVDLSASRPFAAGGFAGTITSTIVITLGRAGATTSLTSTTRAHGARAVVLEADYRVRVAGPIIEHIAGSANPDICGALDSCGVTGTQTLTARSQTGDAEVTVYAPASTPRDRLLALVGIGHARPRAGATALGVMGSRGNGTFTTAVGQGATRCRQTAPLGGLAGLLGVDGGRLGVELLPAGLLTLATPSECPGPAASQLTPLAEGTVPLTALRGGRTRVVLRTGSHDTDDGYTVSTRPDLTVTLRRVAVHIAQIRLPAGLPLP